MPIMDGFEATVGLRQLEDRYLEFNEKRSIIVGLTGHVTENYRKKSFEHGMDYFSKYNLCVIMCIVTKPLDSDKLQ